MRKSIFYLSAITFVVSIFSQGFACTNFVLMDEDRGVVNGRSMEFGVFLDSKILVRASGKHIETTLKGNLPGLSWTTKYSYVGLLATSQDMVCDGMNEAGLSIGALWFPETQYPKVKARTSRDVLPLEALGDFLLGNFSTIEEVRKVLPTLNLYPTYLSSIKTVPPIHLSITDRSGKSLVVEYIDGKCVISDNPVGVLTNSPKFSWHLTNLRNYIGLRPMNSSEITLDGSVINPLGQGTGLMGIPGDWTPPSRFVRIAIFKQFAMKPKTPDESMNLAFHLLNTVDIPYGVIRSSDSKTYDYTQWVVVKDLNRGLLFYRTYGDMNVYSINLKEEVSKARGGERIIPMNKVQPGFN